MKKWILAGFLSLCLAGCEQQQKYEPKLSKIKKPLLFTVDFRPETPLKYHFVCERQITVELDSSARSKNVKNKGASQNISEKLEMDIIYKPVAIDPYGYSIIEATCTYARVSRTGAINKGDAVESLAGKKFTLKITPTGKIVDYSSLENLTKELGEQAFAKSQRSRIKDPDMIMDFLATQWYMWDSISSIKNPLNGVKQGQKWSSQLLAPMPFVSKTARDVEYRLDGIVDINGVSYAQISSNYKLSKSPPDVPMPYSGSFQMRGTFGFLRGYKVISIEGSGKQLYDIKKGVIQSDIQNYNAQVSASIFGLGRDTIEPNIEINQTITMTLVK